MGPTAQDQRTVVIFGPSGVGKGTLVGKLFDTHPGIFTFAVSHTTRQPRAGEVEGHTYFYTTPENFTSMVVQRAFLEHTFYDGNFYGTSKQTIEDQQEKGLVVVLDIDMDGVQQMKADATIDARYVFIKPPSFEILEARLRGRGSEDEGAVQKRLARARIELEYAEQPGTHDKMIINDDLERAYKELEEFVFCRSP